MIENQKYITGLDMDDEEIIQEMEKRINENLMIEQTWRETEVRESYAMKDGDQWLPEELERQLANGMPTITINRVKPILKSIVGFEIQNRLDVKYMPRLNNDQQSGFKDVVANSVKYIKQTTNDDAQISMAFEDMLICGVGATDTVFSYDRPPHNGDFAVERVFPAFIFWDPAARAKNLIDSDYVVRLKIVNRDIIRQEYGVDYYDDIYSSALDARILEFFSSVLAVKQLGVVYEYQFRKKVPIYRVENPFKELNIMEIIPVDSIMGVEELQAFMGSIEALKKYYAEKFNFDPNLDKIFTINDKRDFSEFKEAMNFYGIKITKTEQYKYKYFRAIITGNNLISKAENFSQEGFSIKFMTGEFSEVTQYYYGLMRACKNPQRMLNQVVSDYQGFLNTSPKGGVNIEVDAVNDISAFLDTYSKARMVTVFNPGALAGGKVQPKIAAPIPQGILEMIQYADNQIMQVCGVTPEMMGMLNSKEQNSGFMRQVIKQGLTTLSTYFDARRGYIQEQGRLYIDCVRILCENSEGRLIKDVIGDQNGKYIPLLKDNVAADYDIVIDEMPTSPDEKQDNFEKLVELQMMMMNKPNPVDIMPLILESAPFSKDIINQLKQLMQPPPPPQPDPVNVRLLTTEADYKAASAYKLTMEAMGLEKNLRFVQPKAIADINLTENKAANEAAKIHSMHHDTIDKRINTIFNHQL